MHNKIQSMRVKYRYTYILLRQLVLTDFKLRYQGSVLGYIWSLLRPLALFTILYVVFAKVVGVGSAVPHFASYLLLGIVSWNFFAEITSGSIGSVVARGDLLRKISFPRYAIVLSVSFSALINLLFNLVVLSAVMAIQGVDLRPVSLLAPLYFLAIYVFALGIGFFLSAAFVRYRDINYIWEVIMQALFYATPILYTVDLLTTKYPVFAKIVMINPLAQMIQEIRYVIVTPTAIRTSDISSGPLYVLLPSALIGCTFIFSSFYFKARSKYFAEEI